MTVNLDLLEEKTSGAHWRLLAMIRDYLRHPTERNACYAVGWIAAASEMGHMSGDAATYWRCLVSSFEGADASRTREPLATVRHAFEVRK